MADLRLNRNIRNFPAPIQAAALPPQELTPSAIGPSSVHGAKPRCQELSQAVSLHLSNDQPPALSHEGLSAPSAQSRLTGFRAWQPTAQTSEPFSSETAAQLSELPEPVRRGIHALTDAKQWRQSLRGLQRLGVASPQTRLWAALTQCEDVLKTPGASKEALLERSREVDAKIANFQQHSQSLTAPVGPPMEAFLQARLEALKALIKESLDLEAEAAALKSQRDEVSLPTEALVDAVSLDAPKAERALREAAVAIWDRDDLRRFLKTVPMILKDAGASSPFGAALQTAAAIAEPPSASAGASARIEQGLKLVPSGLRRKLQELERVSQKLAEANRTLLFDSARNVVVSLNLGTEEALAFLQRTHQLNDEQIDRLKRGKSTDEVLGGASMTVEAANGVRSAAASLQDECLPGLANLRAGLLASSGLTDEAVQVMVKNLAVTDAALAQLPSDYESMFADAIRLSGGRGFVTAERVDFVRDRASIFGNTVNTGSLMSASTFLHEVCGHGAEADDPALLADAIGFIESRATSMTPTTLTELTGVNYDSHEIALPGRAVDPYVLKVYTTLSPGENVADALRRSFATEVTAVGVGYFVDAESMASLAAADLEHFYFVLGALRPDLRSLPVVNVPAVPSMADIRNLRG